MGLINSFINQIGREIGRDVYRDIKDYKSIDKRNLTKNESLIKDIQKFELSTRESTNINRLINLVEKTEEVDIKDFDFTKVFTQLDSKIDLVKENSKQKDRIEELDEKNLSNFKTYSILHKHWVQSMISSETSSPKSTYKSFILGMFGLSPFLGKRNSNLILQIISSIFYLVWMTSYISYVYYEKNFNYAIIIFISLQIVLSGVISYIFSNEYNKKLLGTIKYNNNLRLYLKNFPV